MFLYFTSQLISTDQDSQLVCTKGINFVISQPNWFVFAAINLAILENTCLIMASEINNS